MIPSSSIVSYLLTFLLFPLLATAQLQKGGGDSVASLIIDQPSNSEGKSAYLYLKLEHPEGWYSYYYNNAVSDTVRPTIEVKPVSGVTFGPLEYPVPQIKESFGIPSYVYPEEAYVRMKLSFTEDLQTGDSVEIKAQADWQICKESCLSESASLVTSFTLGELVDQKGGALPQDVETRFSSEKEITVKASLKGDEVLLSVKGVNQPTAFFDLTGGTAFNTARLVETDEYDSALLLPLDQGNDFRDPKLLGDSIKGYLISQEGAYWVEAPVLRGDAVKPTLEGRDGDSVLNEHFSVAPAVKIPSSEVLASSYNGDEPISYRTLKDSAPVTFWLALGGAFIGGILLNLMPCVFPVLSLKVLSFVEKAGEDAWKVRLHGLLFALGVMVSMWVLAIALFSIKASTGQSINWGQQMGDSRFVAGVVIVLFLFGLNMAGIFELGTKLTSVGSVKESKNDYLATVFSGVLTTVVATPCSGPFLGAAMGYTLDQRIEVALVIFTVFALGISFPYLLLSFFPALTSKMPRPGTWMETLKKILAFGMFAAAAFFLQTFGAQTGVNGMSLLIMAMVVIGLGAYFYGHWTLPHLKKSVRYGLGFGLSFLVLGAGFFMSWNAATKYKAPKVAEAVKKGGVEWVAWQPGIVEHFRAQGKYVWVDYTANWCLTCQVNKKVIFKDKGFTEDLDLSNTVFVKADMTDNDPTIAKDLSRVQRAQIPVNLLYAPAEDKKAVLLEEVITVADVRKGLDLIAYPYAQ